MDNVLNTTRIDRKSRFNIGDDVYIVDIDYHPVQWGYCSDNHPRGYITRAKVGGFALIKPHSNDSPNYKVIVQNYARFEDPTRYVDEKFLFKSKEEAIWDLVHNPSDYNLSVDDAKSIALSLLDGCGQIL